MPRIGSKQRFAFLEKAAKAAGLTAAPTSPVGKYIAYKKQEVPLKRRKTLTATQIQQQRTRQVIALVPFGVTVGNAYVAADFRSATISQWSALYAASVAGLNEGTDLGWRSPSANTPDGGGFYPAQLIVSVDTAQIEDNAVSPITGKKYKYVAKNSYTIPFGRNATIAAGELARKEAIAGIFQGLATNKPSSLSYKPEYFDKQVEASTEVAGLTEAP